MKKVVAKRTAYHANTDPLSQFKGPSETIAASVPSALASAIRKKVGKREFSAFVGRALAHELVDQSRAAYVESFEKDHGPIDAKLNARLEALFSR
jgi:predicted GTPase